MAAYNYAGVTWSNTRNRKIFLGWMSDWQYDNVVPTPKWRSAMTVPVDIGVEKVGEKFFVETCLSYSNRSPGVSTPGQNLILSVYFEIT